MVRGQLVDNDDFFYKPQQDTVHYYANVVPVWQSVATGNWLVSGILSRKMAGDVRSDLDVWSGTIGTLKLRDYRGVKVNQIIMTDPK